MGYSTSTSNRKVCCHSQSESYHVRLHSHSTNQAIAFDRINLSVSMPDLSPNLAPTKSIFRLIANVDQVLVFRAWLAPPIAPHAKAASHWYTFFSNRLLKILVGIYLFAICSTIANVYTRTTGDEAARKWYTANLAFTIFHMLPSPKILDNLTIIKNIDGDGRTNLKGMEKWLAINTVRLLISDIPAFVSAVIATALTVRI